MSACWGINMNQNKDIIHEITYHSYPFDVFLSVVASMPALLINSCNDSVFFDSSSSFSMDWVNFKLKVLK